MKQKEQVADTQTLFHLLAALANAIPRREAARQLARYLGAEDLLIFLPDTEAGVLLPAPGFAQTLPDGRRWQAFLTACQESGSISATLPFPDATTTTTAIGLANTDRTALVLLGGAPRLPEAALLVTLLPLLEAAFRCEQAHVLAQAEVEIARKTTVEAQALLTALDESRMAAHNELFERMRVEAVLREQLSLAALQMDVSTALTASGALRDILGQCARALVQHLDAAFARIWILNEADQILELQASAGMYTHLDGGHARIRVNDLRIGHIAQTCIAHLTNAVLEDPRISDKEWARREGMVAFAGYPLLVADRLVGVLALFARKPLSDAMFSAMQSVSSAIALGIERSQAEVALKASEERFRTLANQAPIMIWQFDTQGESTYVNTTWCTFTGLMLEESLGTGWMSVIHPEDQQASFSLWREALVSRLPYQTQFRLRRADGVYRETLMYGSACSDQNGRFTGYIGTILDITEQKELERQREVFVSMATHELKTPLTALQGNIQLAERRLRRFRSQLDPQQTNQHKHLDELQTLLTRSQQQVRLQHRLINDLLDISRLQADTQELHLAPCDLASVVQEAVQGQQAAHPQRQFTLSLAEQDEVLVQADRDRIGQVIGNYLTNALKYSPADKAVQVGLSVENHYACVWVADEGPGLSSEQQQQIWERYYRVPGILEQSGSGISLGLGLYICQLIIKSHQGQVGVESTPGQGARFWFILPLLSPET